MAVKRRNGFICKWKLVRMHDTTNAFFWYSWRTCPSDGRNTWTTLLTDFTVSFTSRLHPHQSINLCEWIRSEWYKPCLQWQFGELLTDQRFSWVTFIEVHLHFIWQIPVEAQLLKGWYKDGRDGKIEVLWAFRKAKSTKIESFKVEFH